MPGTSDPHSRKRTHAAWLHAAEMRSNPTPAEKHLWHRLPDQQICGFRFIHQFVIADYVVDFYCHQARLAIEIDGGGHNQQERRNYDRKRTREIEKQGVAVLRFWNNEVMGNLDGVLEQIHEVAVSRARGRA